MPRSKEPQGYIKLFRKLIDSQDWKNSNDGGKILMIVLLLIVSFKERDVVYENTRYTIRRGEIVINYKGIADLATSESLKNENQIYRALKKLRELGFCTSKKVKHGLKISINNFGFWQEGLHLNENEKPGIHINELLKKGVDKQLLKNVGVGKDIKDYKPKSSKNNLPVRGTKMILNKDFFIFQVPEYQAQKNLIYNGCSETPVNTSAVLNKLREAIKSTLSETHTPKVRGSDRGTGIILNSAKERVARVIRETHLPLKECIRMYNIIHAISPREIAEKNSKKRRSKTKAEFIKDYQGNFPVYLKDVSGIEKTEENFRIRLVKYLWGRMTKDFPENVQLKNAKTGEWLYYLHLLVDVDKRDPKKLYLFYENFIRNDKFWFGRIYNLNLLRKHYDRMYTSYVGLKKIEQKKHEPPMIKKIKYD